MSDLFAEVLHLLSPEDQIAATYKELGQRIKNLQDERDAIKATDIWPAIENGIAFHYGDEILVPEYIATTDFDWKRAVKDGAISNQTLQSYSTTKVEARLYFRKVDDDGKAIYEAFLRSLHNCYEGYKHAKEQAKAKRQNEVIR